LMPLVLSGEVPRFMLVAAFVALVASWFYDAPRQRIEEHSLWWNIVTVGALVVLTIFAFKTENYILYAIFFSLVMVVTRLFQSRGSRDVFQLYGLSFVTIVAGAVINPTLSFIFIFVGYVVLLVWGLIFLHLQRDMEVLEAARVAAGERPSEMGWRARDLITARFLLGSSVLALVIFFLSLMIFFFFPRLGMGFFFSQGRSGQTVSGFADSIELGHFGKIKDNLQVVMRVELPGKDANPERQLRMRGISFDRYDGRSWSKTHRQGFELLRQDLGTWSVLHDGGRLFAADGEPLRQTVYLEPLEMDQRMIFGEPSIRELSIDNPELDRLRRHPVRFYQDSAGDISTQTSNNVALRYHVDSYLFKADPALFRQGKGKPPPHVAELYLQLPDNLQDRVVALGTELSKDQPTPYDKAVAIQSYLRSGYVYSTEGGQDPKHPLESFLFDTKRGHCEFFATAMVVLVPAQTGVWGTMDSWVDSLRLQWYKWVVEYDLEKQMVFFRNIGDALGGLKGYFPKPKGSPRRAQSWKDGFKEWLGRRSTWAFLGTPFILLILWRLRVLGWLRDWLIRLWPKRREIPGGEVGLLYDRMLRKLTRQGIGRRPYETPRELANRLQGAGYPSSEIVSQVTDVFERGRYAQKPVDQVTRDEARAALNQLKGF
jgi:hypothetical protein